MSISCGRVPAATQQRVSRDGGYPPVAADGVQFAITLGHASISIVYRRVRDDLGAIASRSQRSALQGQMTILHWDLSGSICGRRFETSRSAYFSPACQFRTTVSGAAPPWAWGSSISRKRWPSAATS